ncbi:MAG TPA: hypothetical protein VMU85_10910 [Stellaceae bacterium]|nr:hypothetical protein [Stellaceae bacterium]
MTPCRPPRSAPRRSPAPAGLAAIAGLALPLLAAPAAAQTSVAYIAVHGDNNNAPLVATVEKLPSDEGKKPMRMGSTELPKGDVTLQPPIACAQGERLHIYVETGGYLGTKVNCAERIAVVLTSWITMQAMLDISSKAVSAQNYGLAAMMSNEAAARLRTVPTPDVEQAIAALKQAGAPAAPPLDKAALIAAFSDELAARQQPDAEAQKRTMTYATWQNVGKFLHVETPSTFDHEHAKFVMSDQSRSAIAKYQTDAGLKATGQLDYPTLQKFAKVDYGDAITKWVQSNTGG